MVRIVLAFLPFTLAVRGRSYYDSQQDEQNRPRHLRQEMASSFPGGGRDSLGANFLESDVRGAEVSIYLA